MAPKPAIHRSVNKWAARIVPLLLAGIVGYVTWVYIALLAVNYLLRPPHHVRPRTGTAIALTVLYFILFLPMVVCYLRVIQVVLTDPGYVPRPDRRHRRRASSQLSEKPQTTSADFRQQNEVYEKGYLDRAAILDGRVQPPSGLESFYSKDLFECDIDGLPRWCSTCQNWKPDRSHHSSEVGRCVYKMDHFCPWAGGIVSETNFKFFTQFCTYTVFFCAFLVITTAYFLSQSGMSDMQKVTWIVMLALAAVFMLFSAGMAINSLHFAFLNTTTVDNLSIGSRTHHFAVYAPELSASTAGYGTTPKFTTITYPLGQASADPAYRRTFAILVTPVGDNPYRLPSLWDNFRTVMGCYWYDWFLPIKHSPCNSHNVHHLGDDDGNGAFSSMYEINPAFQLVMEEAGLELLRRKQKRRRRSYSSNAGDRGSRHDT